MNKLMIIACTVLLSGSLLACAQPGGGGGITKEGGGALVGGVLGGLVGSNVRGRGRTAATIGGALLGGFLGSRVGAGMDQQDKARAEQAMQTQEVTRWRSNTGNQYTVHEPYYDRNRRMCRVLEMRATTGEVVEQESCCTQIQQGYCTKWAAKA